MQIVCLSPQEADLRAKLEQQVRTGFVLARSSFEEH